MRRGLISRRFRGSKPALELNDVQHAARKRVLEKIATGEYGFTDVTCPYCGDSRGRILSERDMYGLPMQIALCDGCGLIYTQRRLCNAALARFYNDEYRPLDRGRALPGEEYFELQRSKGPLIETFVQHHSTGFEKKGLLIEIGCGAGGILSHFREVGWDVVGFDIGLEYVEYGRRHHQLELYCGGVLEASDYLRKIDRVPAFVIYEQVLEHISDPVAELRLVRCLLDRHSLLFIGVPGFRNVDRHYGSDFLRYLQLPHLVHFDLRSLTQITRAAGFELVEGSEMVQAIFGVAATPAVGRAADPAAAGSSMAFIMGLERRYRRRVWAQMCDNALRWLRRNISAVVRAAAKSIAGKRFRRTRAGRALERFVMRVLVRP